MIAAVVLWGVFAGFSQYNDNKMGYETDLADVLFAGGYYSALVVAGISHDLRTPLTAIRGYLDLLDQTEKSETVARYLGVIGNRTDAHCRDGRLYVCFVLPADG